MREKVTAYGFGSYFNGHLEYQDIDILLIHQSNGRESCQFAIQCKRFLVSKYSCADVTILSQHEEQQSSFLERSCAKQLGEIHPQRNERGLLKVAAIIDSYRNQNTIRPCDAEKT